MKYQWTWVMCYPQSDSDICLSFYIIILRNNSEWKSLLLYDLLCDTKICILLYSRLNTNLSSSHEDGIWNCPSSCPRRNILILKPSNLWRDGLVRHTWNSFRILDLLVSQWTSQHLGNLWQCGRLLRIWNSFHFYRQNPQRLGLSNHERYDRTHRIYSSYQIEPYRGPYHRSENRFVGSLWRNGSPHRSWNNFHPWHP